MRHGYEGVPHFDELVPREVARVDRAVVHVHHSKAAEGIGPDVIHRPGYVDVFHVDCTVEGGIPDLGDPGLDDDALDLLVVAVPGIVSAGDVLLNDQLTAFGIPCIGLCGGDHRDQDHDDHEKEHDADSALPHVQAFAASDFSGYQQDEGGH